jgi:hypothetical protein
VNLIAAASFAVPARAQDPGSLEVEVWGGYASMGPSDLNLAVAHDTGVQGFLFDEKYAWRASRGEILSWTRTGAGEREELTHAFPKGARVKYSLNGWLAVSLGLTRLSRTESLAAPFEYSSSLAPGYGDVERIEVAPFSLSAEAYAPLAGVHLRKPSSSRLGLEVFVLGGPIHVDAHYEQNLSYQWFSQEAGRQTLVFEEQSRRVEDGSGNGLALEVGARLKLKVHGRWGLSLDAGYAHRKVGSLTGSGSETRNGETQSWQGDWRVRQVQLEAPWGARSFEYPTSFAGPGPGGGASRSFELDLSGLQLRLGLVFGF